MFTLQNEKLKISVNPVGAELSNIESVKTKTKFMWDANPDVWGSYAPNLFPIIGALKEGIYTFEGKTYALPKHGFIRNNTNVKLIEQTESSLTFGLTYSVETLKMYPFKFEFLITYTLKDNSLEVSYTVKNVDTQDLYFSVGGHPAFKCPLFENESYADYYLEFEHDETSESYLTNVSTGLISDKTKPVFNTPKTINLHDTIFNDDALIFKNLSSRKVSLKSRNHGEILSFSYPDFNYLGIWAKPHSHFVCIEPWLGIADPETANQNLVDKEGILKLEANKTFKATYTIEINHSHLLPK